MGKRKTLLLLLAALLMLPVGGCGGEALTDRSQDQTSGSQTQEPVEERTRLSVSLSSPENSTTVQVLQTCAKELRESEGRGLDVFKIYAEGRMGNDELLLEGAIQGTLSMVKMDIGQLERAVPEVALLTIPFTFRSPEEYNQLLDGPFGDRLQECFAQKGLRLLDATATSWKYLTTNVALRTPEDLKKVNIRLVDNSAARDTWRGTGAQAGVLDYTELYMALQDGTFNTQENPIQMVVGTSLDEVQSYLIDARHQLAVHTFVMNLDQYNALTQENREDMEEFIRSFQENYRRAEEKEAAAALDTLEERGTMQFLELPASVRSALVAAREPVLADLRQTLGEETVDLFLTSLATVRHGN